MRNFSQNQNNYSQEESDLKKNLSSALRRKIDLLARLYGERKITLSEISLILGIDIKETESIFIQNGAVEKNFSRRRSGIYREQFCVSSAGKNIQVMKLSITMF